MCQRDEVFRRGEERIRDGVGGTNIGAGSDDVSEASGGRVRLISAEGFGVEPWIVCEPPHVGYWLRYKVL